MTGVYVDAQQSPSVRAFARTDRPELLVPAFLLIVGLFFPTSVRGNIVVSLPVAHAAMFGALCLWIGLTRDAFGSVFQRWIAAFIVAWLLAMTVLSPFRDLAVGAMANYVPLALLFALDLRSMRIARRIDTLLTVTTLAVLAVGALAIGGSLLIRRVIVASYSSGYPDLVANMLLLRKPVFTFGSHAVAGFFYFLLFYLNLETYRARHSVTHLWLATTCVLGGFFLTSVTAGILMTWASALLFLGAKGHRVVLTVCLVGVAALGITFLSQQLGDLRVLAGLLSSFSSQANGLRGRYSAGGNLLSNLEWLRLHPLRPVGLTYSSSLFFGDSGAIEYLTRGSLPLLLAVYGAFTLFLWKGLLNRRHALFLLCATLAFETGFSVMMYHRYLYLLTFTVLYLNHLSSLSDAARAPAIGSEADGERCESAR